MGAKVLPRITLATNGVVSRTCNNPAIIKTDVFTSTSLLPQSCISTTTAATDLRASYFMTIASSSSLCSRMIMASKQESSESRNRSHSSLWSCSGDAWLYTFSQCGISVTGASMLETERGLGGGHRDDRRLLMRPREVLGDPREPCT